MIEPLRFGKETLTTYEIEKPGYCVSCLSQRQTRNNPNIAVVFCQECPNLLAERKEYGALLCNSCNQEKHKHFSTRLHVRQIVVVGPGLRKKMIHRGDGISYPLTLDNVTVTMKARIFHNGVRVHREKTKRLNFLVGMSGKCLHIQVLGGRNLGIADVSNTSDPYVIYSYCGKPLGSTRIRPRTLNPRWDNETFIIPLDEALPAPRNLVHSQKDLIKLEVYDHDWLSQNDFMGHIEMTRSKLMKLAVVSQEKPIRIPLTAKERHGILSLQFGVTPKNLYLRVLCAEDLDKSSESIFNNPYAKIYLGERTLLGVTPVVKREINPIWTEKNEFMIPFSDYFQIEELVEAQLRYYRASLGTTDSVNNQHNKKTTLLHNRHHNNKNTGGAGRRAGVQSSGASANPNAIFHEERVMFEEFNDYPEYLSILRIEIYNKRLLREDNLLGKTMIHLEQLHLMVGPRLKETRVQFEADPAAFKLPKGRLSLLLTGSAGEGKRGSGRGGGDREGGWEGIGRMITTTLSQCWPRGRERGGEEQRRDPRFNSRKLLLPSSERDDDDLLSPSSPDPLLPLPSSSSTPVSPSEVGGHFFPGPPPRHSTINNNNKNKNNINHNNNHGQEGPDNNSNNSKSRKQSRSSLKETGNDNDDNNNKNNNSESEESWESGEEEQEEGEGGEKEKEKEEEGAVEREGGETGGGGLNDKEEEDEQEQEKEKENTHDNNNDVNEGEEREEPKEGEEEVEEVEEEVADNNNETNDDNENSNSRSGSGKSSSSSGSGSNNNSGSSKSKKSSASDGSRRGGEEQGGGSKKHLLSASASSQGQAGSRRGMTMTPLGKMTSFLARSLSLRGGPALLEEEEESVEPEPIFGEIFRLTILNTSRKMHLKDVLTTEGVGGGGSGGGGKEDLGFLVVRLLISNRGSVLPGIDESVQRMTLGETALVKSRFDYSYGSYTVHRNIPPRSNIHFTIKLEEINGAGKYGLLFGLVRRVSRWIVLLQKSYYRYRYPEEYRQKRAETDLSQPTDTEGGERGGKHKRNNWCWCWCCPSSVLHLLGGGGKNGKRGRGGGDYTESQMDDDNNSLSSEEEEEDEEEDNGEEEENNQRRRDKKNKNKKKNHHRDEDDDDYDSEGDEDEEEALLAERERQIAEKQREVKPDKRIKKYLTPGTKAGAKLMWNTKTTKLFSIAPPPPLEEEGENKENDNTSDEGGKGGRGKKKRNTGVSGRGGRGGRPVPGQGNRPGRGAIRLSSVSEDHHHNQQQQEEDDDDEEQEQGGNAEEESLLSDD
jgi:hypothetical protein